MSRRAAALLALVALILGLAMLGWAVVATIPHGIVATVLMGVSLALLWQGLIRRGASRAMWWTVAAVLAAGAVAALVVDGIKGFGLVGIGLVVVALALARRAFSVHRHLTEVLPPARPVVVYNPKSGGGKATRFHLADEARARGITPIELRPGDDLDQLVRTAVAEGADGLMAAGGDGTQALVAAIAAEHDLPFACIPAGTRNHFALDLGVDRTDVVGALDAFVRGGEKRVDLGDIGGRVFVNNVSLGVYAEAVQREGYRDAKIRTLLDTVPTLLAADPAQRSTRDLEWTGAEGQPERSAAVILVSNNVYRLGRVLGSGTRPRMDAGVLGITVLGALDLESGHRSIRSEWSQPEFVVESDGDIPVGIDGEALTLPSPLVFRIRPGALRVRIAPHHPGASPSSALPTGLRDGIRRLAAMAAGRDPAAMTLMWMQRG